jgi:cytochrome c553
MKPVIIVLAALGLAAADLPVVRVPESLAEDTNALEQARALLKDAGLRLEVWREGREPAVLLDTGGIVRREFTGRDLNVVVREARAWSTGRDVYGNNCARCHGVLGDDTNYPNIKTLTGIGKRYSLERIQEITDFSNSVDMTRFDSDAKRALAIYVAGL